jgi:hypothetical protein
MAWVGTRVLVAVGGNQMMVGVNVSVGGSGEEVGIKGRLYVGIAWQALSAPAANPNAMKVRKKVTDFPISS